MLVGGISGVGKFFFCLLLVWKFVINSNNIKIDKNIKKERNFLKLLLLIINNKIIINLLKININKIKINLI